MAPTWFGAGFWEIDFKKLPVMPFTDGPFEGLVGGEQ
jgi:hypothetical protein